MPSGTECNNVLVLRSSFGVLRSSFFVLRSAFFVGRSALGVGRSSFGVWRWFTVQRPSPSCPYMQKCSDAKVKGLPASMGGLDRMRHTSFRKQSWSVAGLRRPWHARVEPRKSSQKTIQVGRIQRDSRRQEAGSLGSEFQSKGLRSESTERGQPASFSVSQSILPGVSCGCLRQFGCCPWRIGGWPRMPWRNAPFACVPQSTCPSPTCSSS